MVKKSFITLVGGLLVLLGLIFLIVPGPSLILLIPGFYLLSLEYPAAEVWLRRCQKLLSKSARYLDKAIRKRRYSKTNS